MTIMKRDRLRSLVKGNANPVHIHCKNEVPMIIYVMEYKQTCFLSFG